MIDLALLEEKKKQYLSFDKNDKILEIISGNINDNANKIMVALPNNNGKIDRFIYEKEEYLRNIGSKEHE